MADPELAPEDLPAVETPSEPQEQVETPELETEQVDGEEGQTTDDEEDFEAEDGQKYRVPKSLVPYLMRNKDYTQKRQADAETARTLAAREAEIEERAKVTDEELDARAELKTIAKELERFEGYDFAAYQQAYALDPIGAQQAWDYLNHIKSQKAELDNKIGTAQKQRTEKAERELATRVQDTVAWAQKEIPNWKPELTNNLVKFALDSGVPETTLKANWSPPLYKLLHRAYLGEQLLKKQSAPKPTTPTPPPEPLKTVKAKAAPKPNTLSDNLSPDEWMRIRNQQVRPRTAQGRYR